MNNSGFTFMGITIHDLTLSTLRGIVKQSILQREKIIIGNHNLHSMYVCHHDSRMQQFYNRCSYIHVDGVPVIWLANLFNFALKLENRLAIIDWLPVILEDCFRGGYRVFFLGSKPGVAERTACHFRRIVPRLDINVHHGYFNTAANSAENQAVIRMINEYQPQLLFVGMGMPRQERWIIDNLDMLHVNVIFNQGAFMDYFAGEKPVPPRWLGRLGLEWLFRLICEPKRLCKRYLIEPWFLVKLLIKEKLSKSYFKNM